MRKHVDIATSGIDIGVVEHRVLNDKLSFFVFLVF